MDSFTITSQFLVAVVYKQIIKQPNRKRFDDMKEAEGRASALVAEAALCTVSDTLFLCKPCHSHPNSPKSQAIYFLPG